MNGKTYMASFRESYVIQVSEIHSNEVGHDFCFNLNSGINPTENTMVISDGYVSFKDGDISYHVLTHNEPLIKSVSQIVGQILDDQSKLKEIDFDMGEVIAFAKATSCIADKFMQDFTIEPLSDGIGLSMRSTDNVNKKKIKGTLERNKKNSDGCYHIYPDFLLKMDNGLNYYMSDTQLFSRSPYSITLAMLKSV
jgi:hypothetical protein